MDANGQLLQVTAIGIVQQLCLGQRALQCLDSIQFPRLQGGAECQAPGCRGRQAFDQGLQACMVIRRGQGQLFQCQSYNFV